MKCENESAFRVWNDTRKKIFRINIKKIIDENNFKNEHKKLNIYDRIDFSAMQINENENQNFENEDEDFNLNSNLNLIFELEKNKVTRNDNSNQNELNFFKNNLITF